MSEEKVNRLVWDKFKEQFHESWHPYMQPIIESEDVFEIYNKIRKDSNRGKKIAPKSENTYRAFREMNLNNLKVVWILMDPYPGNYDNGQFHATGIAMDCSNSPNKKIQPSLTKFYDAIQNSYKEDVDYSPSLSYLQEQGVMLLNSDLTCELRKTSSHEGLWLPFMKRVLEDILFYRNGLIYVFSGKSSRRLEKFVSPLGNYLFYTEHPAAAAHGERSWDYDNIFKKINFLIEGNLGLANKIIWNKKELDKKIEECPF